MSSAVATKIADPDLIIYIDIEDQHPDTMRFVKDCEKWFDKEVVILRSRFRSVENCCLSVGFIKSAFGAACTDRLKKRVRKEWEYAHEGRHIYIWGFDKDEKDRADRTVAAMPQYDHRFPILDRTKAEVHGIIEAALIKRPAMYDLGVPVEEVRVERPVREAPVANTRDLNRQMPNYRGGNRAY